MATSWPSCHRSVAADIAARPLIFVLPGSLDAVQTAWDRLIRAQLDVSTRPCNLVQLLPRLQEPLDRPAGRD